MSIFPCVFTELDSASKANRHDMTHTTTSPSFLTISVPDVDGKQLVTVDVHQQAAQHADGVMQEQIVHFFLRVPGAVRRAWSNLREQSKSNTITTDLTVTC